MFVKHHTKLVTALFNLLVANVFILFGSLHAAEINYKYDELGRLTDVIDSENPDQAYEYDPAGNRTSVVTGTTVVEPPPPPPPTNSTPTALDDRATVTLGSSTLLNPLANDSDPDGDTLSIISFTQPPNAYVTKNANNTFTITGSNIPSGAYTYTRIFTYTISDGNGLTDTATIAVTVTR